MNGRDLKPDTAIPLRAIGRGITHGVGQVDLPDIVADHANISGLLAEVDYGILG